MMTGLEKIDSEKRMSKKYESSEFPKAIKTTTFVSVRQETKNERQTIEDNKEMRLCGRSDEQRTYVLRL